MREGANEVVPVDWASVKIRMQPKVGYIDLFNDDLCPLCQEVVLEALKPPVKTAEVLNERLETTAGRKWKAQPGQNADGEIDA